MIVVDASVVVDLLLGPSQRRSAAVSRLASERSVAAPVLLDAEVLSAIRKAVLKGVISPEAAEAAVENLLAMPVRRIPLEPLLKRAFEMRDNLTAYDALYVAAAEAVGGPLVTRDGAFLACPGRKIGVEILP